MLASQLCPLRKLVLATRRVELSPHTQVISLQLLLLGGILRSRDGEQVQGRPQLPARQYCPRTGLPSLRWTNRIVDRGGANSIDDMDNDFDEEHDDQKVRHGQLAGEGSESGGCRG